MAKRGIGFEACCENAILACDDPATLPRIAGGLSAAKIDSLLRRWLARLPHPFTRADRRAGFRDELSLLQAEFALTHVLDRPLPGRIFVERVIRDNIDLGRPRNVQLLFDRRLQKNTPSRFRSRVITQGVVPSLWIDDKSSTVKQSFKQSRALRTQTTVNNTRDSAGSAGLCLRLPASFCNSLPQPGRAVRTKQRCCPVVLAVLTALLVFRLLPRGFSNRDLRDHLAQLLTRRPGDFTRGQMTYHLRLKGLIRRIPGTHRYEVTDEGLRAALFYAGSFSRIIRPFASALQTPHGRLQHRLLEQLRRYISSTCKQTAA